MIEDNEENSERLTQFIDILKIQLLREDKDFVAKIICHMFKMAKFIFNDRASVLMSENGINQKLPSGFTSVSQLDKWLNLIETVSMRTPSDTNIKNQIIYFKIIASMLRDKCFY